MTSEISIRLLASASRKAALLAHPLLAGGGLEKSQAAETERLYFDTADLDLGRQHTAVHIGAGKRGTRQTLETLQSRTGWITVLQRVTAGAAGAQPALDTLRALSAAMSGAFEPPPAHAQLIKIFAVRLRSSSGVVRFGRARVEVTLEHGELRTDSKRKNLDDLVLRLLAGPPSALAELATRLQADCRLHLEARSIAERGRTLHRAVPPAVEHAQGFLLWPEMTTEEAFAVVIRQCINLYRLNEDGIRDGDDPESVHQARVALRQLASACSVFASAVPPRATQDLLDQVKWLARILGEVRDWEVLRTETFAEAPRGMLEGAQLDAFDQALLVRISAARARMQRALRSLRYAALQVCLTRWAAGQPWRNPLAPHERRALAAPVRDCADKELTARRKRLLKKGAGLVGASPERRHQARIAAKKLRYAIDFFESLYPAKATTAYSRALKKVQDALGALNDNRVARERLRQMAAVPMTATHPPIRSVNLERYLSAQEAPMLEKLVRVWKRLKDVPPPVALPEES